MSLVLRVKIKKENQILVKYLPVTMWEVSNNDVFFFPVFEAPDTDLSVTCLGFLSE